MCPAQRMRTYVCIRTYVLTTVRWHHIFTQSSVASHLQLAHHLFFSIACYACGRGGHNRAQPQRSNEGSFGRSRAGQSRAISMTRSRWCLMKLDSTLVSLRVAQMSAVRTDGNVTDSFSVPAARKLEPSTTKRCRNICAGGFGNTSARPFKSPGGSSMHLVRDKTSYPTRAICRGRCCALLRTHALPQQER